MSKRCREGQQLVVYDDTPPLSLGNIEHHIKERIVDILQFDTPVLILVNKDWNRFFKEIEQEETWDARMKRWYLSHIAPTDLAYINYHDRDKHINMNEALHKYTIIHWLKESGSFSIIHSRPKSDPNRWKGLMSPTGFIDLVFDEFHDDTVIAEMMARPRWNRSKYFGMTPEQIKAQWLQIKETAAAEGTAMHLNLENYYNGKPHDTTTKEFALFQVYENEILEADELIPWRTEQRLFDLHLMFSGSVDMMYTPKDPLKRFDARGRQIIVMADWKRAREPKYENRWQKGNCSLTANTDDTNVNHYYLQLRIYKIMLERNYNVVVRDMYLLVLHPNQDEPLKITVPLEPRTEARIIQYRRGLLKTAQAA